VLNYLRRRAQFKGVVGGSRGWTILWAVLMGGRLLRRFTSDAPEVVFTRKLRAGESVVIRSEHPEPSKRQQRKQRKQQQRAEQATRTSPPAG
jgi:hypothetical protein